MCIRDRCRSLFSSSTSEMRRMLARLMVIMTMIMDSIISDIMMDMT